MNYKVSIKFMLLSLTVCAPFLNHAEVLKASSDVEVYTLPTLTVRGQETANILPATTFESVVSNLDFDPRIDFQSRNITEAQGDVSIRGGIFEGTGFQVGAVTLLDPQTGHYSTELPIAPEMLGKATVLTGADNALYGFNSTAGTIRYDWSEITQGGSTTLGLGDNTLNFQRLHNAWVNPLKGKDGWTLGFEAEVSRSESDGTIAFGDHDFDRTTARVQLLGPNSQTDFFAGYQRKFFGWPAMYTANKFINPIEYENIKTRLFVINHRQNYSDNNFIEFTATHRRNSDTYQLDAVSRTSGNPFTYIATHETKVSALGLNGFHQLNSKLGIRYAGQLTADTIDSTALKNATRSYLKFSVLPEYQIASNSNEELTFGIGCSFDDSNRDDAQFSLISNLKWQATHANGNSESISLSYSEASQVAGYTAIGDAQGGPFLSNEDLNREQSQTLELAGRIQRENYKFEGAVFYRWDNDLVDWTYSNGDPFARSATGVDLETFGIELIASKRWDAIEAIASYTFLEKDEDYGQAAIDASFYALNYAKHRITLGAIWTPNSVVQVRIDNEWRSQEANALRTSDNEALLTHIGLSIFPPNYKGLELFAAVNNAWDDDFQDVPGTPGQGSQVSCGATYRW
jgi:hypothetical protein